MSLAPGLNPLRFFFHNYNLVSTSYTFQLYDTPTQGFGGIDTTGSSTTIVSLAGIPVPAFVNNGVGDILEIRSGGAGGSVLPITSYRKIVTYTSADTVVVDSAIDLGAGVPSWSYHKLRGGTAATDGWLHVGSERDLTVAFYAPTLGETDGVDFVIQGKGGHELAGDPLLLYSANTAAAAAGFSDFIPITEAVNFIRVGMKAKTAATGTDSISAYLISRKVS